MLDADSRRFAFASSALADATFEVLRFEGKEGLSQCYRFEIDLVSTQAALDLGAVLQAPATFTILRKGGDLPFHGILANFEQLHRMGDRVLYKAILVPRLWWLSQTQHNQIFLGRTAPQFLQSCLEDGGLTDLEFRLQGDYEPWEYICQYGESHLDFASRWLEHQGMYFYFEQDGRDKVIVTDSAIAHGPMAAGAQARYQPPAGLGFLHREELIHQFLCRQSALPQKVLLRDWNYQKPSLELSAEAAVSAQGLGQVYLYGEHFRTPKEGERLAQIRSQELLCRERRYYGESTVPFLRPGYTFKLVDHYREDFNGDLLTVALQHRGSQAAFLLAGLPGGLSEEEREPYYRNTVEAISSAVQFRPERRTPRARIFGTLSARIDAAGSGQYAELDGHGRYKVILPFDLSDRKSGKASAWLRMMQPYAGSDHGMHMPLHKGTEVMLAFHDGDPDRPFIAGAVPNPENPSMVKDENQSMAVIQTGAQNRIAIEDQAGKERILLHSPKQGSYLRIGAHNDPPPPPEEDSGGEEKGPLDSGLHLFTIGKLEVKATTKNELVLGESAEVAIGLKGEFFFGGAAEIAGPDKWKWAPLDTEVDELKTELGTTRTDIRNLQTTVNQDHTEIGQLHTQVTQDHTAINQLRTEVSQDHTTIGQLDTRVSQNATHIGQVDTRVTQNATRLGQVVTRVSQNATNIGQLITCVAQNTTSIGQAQTQIQQVDNLLGTTRNTMFEMSAELNTVANKVAATMNII